MRPPFSYFGGKQTIAGAIISHLPAHVAYVEPYAGGLSVLLAKPPAKMEVANDIDGELMTFWRVLRDQPEALERVCALTPHSRAEFAAADDRAGLNDLELARRVWVRLTQGRGGQLSLNGWRNHVAPPSCTAMPRYLTGYVARMAGVAERLAGVTLECLPALEIIDRYGHPDTLLYVDPPYLGSTRRSGRYQVEMSGDRDHRDLADALHATPSPVVLSGYGSPLYDTLYGDWCRVEIHTQTGNGADRARTEVLWSNRDISRQPNLLEAGA